MKNESAPKIEKTLFIGGELDGQEVEVPLTARTWHVSHRAPIGWRMGPQNFSDTVEVKHDSYREEVFSWKDDDGQIDRHRVFILYGVDLGQALKMLLEGYRKPPMKGDDFDWAALERLRKASA